MRDPLLNKTEKKGNDRLQIVEKIESELFTHIYKEKSIEYV